MTGSTPGETTPLVGTSSIPEGGTISPTLRWTTNLLSLLATFLFSGIVFGWAPLELMLIREGQYHEVCPPSAAGADQEEDDDVCPDQALRLQTMFTLAQFLLSFLSPFVGWMVDHAPKLVYYALTALTQMGGLILFAYCDSQTFDYFLWAYGLLAFGGAFTMLGAFPASFLLPKYQTGILASISCLFDASSIIFFLFHRLDLTMGISREIMFLTHAGLALLVYVALAICWVLLERQAWKQVIAYEMIQQELEPPKSDDDKNNHGTDTGGEGSNALHKLGLWKQLQTTEFGLSATFMSVHMLRCNYYIMTIDDFLRYLGDTDGYYANVFSLVLPMGVVCIPLIEFTISKLGVLKSVHLTNLIGLVFGAMPFAPTLDAQVVGFCLMAAFRAYLYATVNTMVAVFFGVETMGQVLGLCMFSAAVVSLLQYPAAIYASAGHWFETAAIMLGICIIPIVYGIFYRATHVSPPPPEIPQFGSPFASSRGSTVLMVPQDVLDSMRKDWRESNRE